MIYECEQCEKPLSPGVVACPNCGEAFDEPVPLDATIRKSGWRKATEDNVSDVVTTSMSPQPKEATQSESYADYILPDQKPATRSSQSVHANQHSSYWSFTVLSLLLWPVGLIVGIVFLTKSTLRERKLGEHTIVMSILGLILGAVLSTLMLGSHTALPNATSSSSITTPTVSNADEPATDKNSSNSDTGDTNVSPLLNEPELEKGSENFSDESGFDKVSGEVTNISSQSLKNVEAETTFYDGSGNVVKTTSALLQLNPILPGQTSSYETIDTDNPAIKREKTKFSILMGGSVLFRTKSSSDTSSTASTDPSKAVTDFRSRLMLSRNEFFAKYVVVSEPGDDYGILNLTMTPEFAPLSQAKKSDAEYHLWHLWHHVSNQDGDTVNFNASDNKAIGSMENGRFSDAH